ncbi:MAG: hypothetical protein JRJ42_11355 [Deltaproteobacteria bacterium]|nr:hypothetical protein [Deltaproteobacteria bacterium]MBW2021201.1 hypothetical protein [Deltaproteobacteria bacterium]
MKNTSFPIIVEKLAAELEAMREQFVFGAVSGLKSEGAPVSNISPILEKGSELDSALKAFQLTCVVGFAWNYIQFSDQLEFDQAITQRLDDTDGARVKEYRERYLDCEGEIDSLCARIAEDVHRIWGRPEPSYKFKRALSNAAAPLGIVSQAAMARICGDSRTEKKLKSKLRI